MTCPRLLLCLLPHPRVVFSTLVCILCLPTTVQPATTVSKCKVDTDDTTAVDLITHYDVTQHCDQVHKPDLWCNDDHLELNAGNVNKILFSSGKINPTSPLVIYSETVPIVDL